jgi:hypothetical protein
MDFRRGRANNECVTFGKLSRTLLRPRGREENHVIPAKAGIQHSPRPALRGEGNRVCQSTSCCFAPLSPQAGRGDDSCLQERGKQTFTYALPGTVHVIMILFAFGADKTTLLLLSEPKMSRYAKAGKTVRKNLPWKRGAVYNKDHYNVIARGRRSS